LQKKLEIVRNYLTFAINHLKQTTTMANLFDRIFKEEAEVLIKAIATKVLGITDFEQVEIAQYELSI
jgi:hypothetical protein